MKIAIISDIHGNLEALKATLKDIEKRKVDKIICLGDIIVKGVHPKECISLIRTNCEQYYKETVMFIFQQNIRILMK